MKRGMLICTIIVTILIFGAGCNNKTDIVKGAEVVEIDLNDFFVGYEGCFIIYDEKESRYSIYNEAQVDERLTPCSTFKIPNALIGLESGIIEGKDYVYQWDGKTNQIDSWNKDHTLVTAIANSVVWYFQRLAQNVGEDRMQEYLSKIDYGNNDISGGITKFWLGSSLKVSAREQVEFLMNLYHDKLPFSKENMKTVREIIILETNDRYAFSGKTGTGENTVGWFVGTIQEDDDIYYFATNIIGGTDATGPKAKVITKEILKHLKLYEN